MFEFHVSRSSRDRYQFDQSIYKTTGNVILADIGAARAFAEKINALRDVLHRPETVVKSGDILVMGLIDEVLHAIVADYRRQINPAIMAEVLEAVEKSIGQEAVDKILFSFTDLFPTVAIYNGQETVSAHLQGATDTLTHREIAIEELLMLWLANENPAFSKHIELFDDGKLKSETEYEGLIEKLDQFFRDQPGLDSGKGSLLDILMLPARTHPHSLADQLRLLQKSFPDILESVEVRYLRSLDLLQEENKLPFGAPGPAEVTDFHSIGLSEEIEQFSADQDWMPSLVLIAKNAYVWLDQLSKKYGRQISQLNQVPFEELRTLANRGFSGLWLIGLWERSPASKTIKHLTGNPDAVSSAYSLYDYAIANDLGGDSGFEALRQTANAAGLRLAADMVPNHTGVYSKWVLEHPDWFISLDEPPYPIYSFNGPDLSSHPGVGIFLEDHYYERTDAAVVFKRVDRSSGAVQYIYHGNDGTSMPWNDTAQLNYLSAEVREAVIQTILNVARKFSIIRFDAAMTLAKKHIQRLWYPEPGQGGAIPSRSEHSISKKQFNLAIPEEFWREVVDRVAEEVPGTLLLAEAFWLMEGYFVRTLGMHRVYNSAFMHMLKDEKNEEYRQVVKNTLAFDPQILKRYVNFMNNPDEDTAISQFGDGGKFFGVSVLMSTMPGLPMYGHGQVEGFHEKYGMEYQRAYYDETPNDNLIFRHEREIAPLLFKRAIFAEVDHFLFFDFKENHRIHEDVFAYSNFGRGEASLVIFHNRWGDIQGKIEISCEFAIKDDQENVTTVTRSIADGLRLPNDPFAFVIFRETISGLQYIRSCKQIHREGFEITLGAFDYRVFLDFQVVYENQPGHYGMLTGKLAGRGVHSIEEARSEMALEPVLAPFRALLSQERLMVFADVYAKKEELPAHETEAIILETGNDFAVFLSAVNQQVSGDAEIEPIQEIVTGLLDRIFSNKFIAARPHTMQDWIVLSSFVFLQPLGSPVRDSSTYPATSLRWLDELKLGKIIQSHLISAGADSEADDVLIKLLIGSSISDWTGSSGLETVKTWLNREEVSKYLKVNSFEEILWFDTDRLNNLIFWIRYLAQLTETSVDKSDLDSRLSFLDEISNSAAKADHKIKHLLAHLEELPGKLIPPTEES